MITLKTILRGPNAVPCLTSRNGAFATASVNSYFEKLASEYGLLLRQYGRVQMRCSGMITAQAQEITKLRSGVIRLRAEVMIGVTRLAFEREDRAALEDVLVAADLVICQTGCVSHDAYWRVQDHCKRTGKQCVLVDQPTAIKVRQMVSA